MDDSRHPTSAPPEAPVKEFTLRAALLGVVLAAFMGAANAYLGLKAGMTIAATYTTAVVGMAVIKAFKGTILEENFARTVGSIGGNIASGAIFTLPAFFIAGIWLPFYSPANYLTATIVLIVGGILGIMFVTITRRVLVGDKDLPFPESVAAAEIHKAGQKGAGGTGFLLTGMALGALFTSLTEFKLVALKWQKILTVGKGSILLRGPETSPAFLGVGYIIGPKLAAINFSGGVLAWGLLAPALAFFLNRHDLAVVGDWAAEITRVWRDYVRYIAIGGMLVGAFYTLFKMRSNLARGLARSLSTVSRGRAGSFEAPPRTDRDIDLRWAAATALGVATVVFLIFNRYSRDLPSSFVAVLLMMTLGFVFAAVSGYLVGVIGVSSNPTSGLTVSVLIIVAFIMVLMGLQGKSGVSAVLLVAAFTCVSVSVAGEMMQDLKAGHILGGTPWRMQLGDILGVTAASLVMFFVLSILHLGNIKQTVAGRLQELAAAGITEVTYEGRHPAVAAGTYGLDDIKAMIPERQNEILRTNAGFGGEKIAAPQASLMAAVAGGIFERKMEWILILTGAFMGLAFILMQVRSPMLIAVGMYLPIDTSFAIFLGGAFKAVLENRLAAGKIEGEKKERAANSGTLLASGLIAGEALIGIVFATLAFAEVDLPQVFKGPSYSLGLVGLLVLGGFLVFRALRAVRHRPL
ncbi:MAG: oligopeptide transporter, OPT family [Candidatus Aminicenantes bacterium RBG_16_63_16]|nr:MAG: oligopeptide transporter, OPT family [Candidatus Aminicenantes bacterium RBG_16_63_16]